VEHHIFSNKREEWFELNRADSVLRTSAVRNRVEFGPVEVDRTVTFDPHVIGARLPFRVDESWSGTWEGRTYGEYRSEVFERAYIVVEGKRLEVWGTEVLMHMRGEIEGEVLTRSWIAPRYALIVKQYQRISIETGAYSYRTEWTGQVASLTPSR
jgi:hypothetical protein